MKALTAVTELAEEMAGRHSLDALLQLIADRTKQIVGAKHVTVRLLNPAQTHLLAVARAGQPLHDRPQEFKVGEGLIGHVAATGRALRTGDPESHPQFVARPGMPDRMGSFLAVPLRAGSGVVGVLSVVDLDLSFTEEHEQLLVLVAALSAPYVEMARLARLSHVDPLTGALNRRGLDASFPEVVSEAPGVIVPLSVVMADVDHFKRVNDEHGHAVGDMVLQRVTQLLGEVVRAGDAVVRYGGEEMLLVLPQVDRGRAAAIAERARLTVRMTAVPTPSGPVTVTLSLGVAERRPRERRDALIARADAALYQAKQTGRDRVCLAD